MNNFTPRAQQVLALARREADRLNHNYVGTEHLLLGLLKLGQGIAVNVLQRLGLDLETVRMEVEKQVGPGLETKMAGNIPYTPRVKKVLALASKEAKALNQSYVGTEHILLGLFREGDGVAARVLKTLEVDIERTRNEILKELDPNFTFDDGENLPPRDYTPRAKEVLVLSRKEAERLRHGYLGAEHLLLGLLSFGQGTVVDVFQKRGLNLEAVRTEVEKQTGLGPETASSGLIPYAPCTMKALVQAAMEARALRHSYVGTEHLLLGLLGDEEGGAARVLKALEIDREQTRADILKELDPHLMWPEKKPEEASAPMEIAARLQKLSAQTEITPVQTRLDCLEEEIGRLRAQISSGEALPDGTPIPPLQNIHEEIRQIREDFSQKFDTVIRRLDSLAADLTRLRDDVLKGKS